VAGDFVAAAMQGDDVVGRNSVPVVDLWLKKPPEM
jgi:hypothetical protein